MKQSGFSAANDSELCQEKVWISFIYFHNYF